MNEFQISCINKLNRQSLHEHITHIGNLVGNWRITRELAITRIDLKVEAYYTVDPLTNRKAYIGVVRGDGNKMPYLRTHADGKWNDNLLALPECSAQCKIIG